MAGKSEQVGFRTDPETVDRIKAYRDRKGLDSLSAAGEELVNVGLRESRRPLLYRLKDRAADIAFWCVMGAIVSVVIGYTTTALTPPHGLRVGLVFLAVGLGVLGLAELLRAVSGQSEVGARLREVLG